MGIYAVTAQPQDQVDEAMKQWGLHFKVGRQPWTSRRKWRNAKIKGERKERGTGEREGRERETRKKVCETLRCP